MDNQKAHVLRACLALARAWCLGLWVRALTEVWTRANARALRVRAVRGAWRGKRKWVTSLAVCYFMMALPGLVARGVLELGAPGTAPETRWRSVESSAPPQHLPSPAQAQARSVARTIAAVSDTAREDAKPRHINTPRAPKPDAPTAPAAEKAQALAKKNRATWKSIARRFRPLPEKRVVGILRKAGFPEHSLNEMVCTAKYESSFNPKAKNLNFNGTQDTGLFQINDIWLKGCKVTRKGLLDPHVNARCALKVYSDQGLSAWMAFNAREKECRTYRLPEDSRPGAVKAPVVLARAQERAVRSQQSQPGARGGGGLKAPSARETREELDPARVSRSARGEGALVSREETRKE